MEPQSNEAVLSITRRVLLIILVLAMAGIIVELLLLEHFEDVWQTIPLVVLVVGLMALGWHARMRSVASTKTLHAVMTLCLVSGILGVFLHYRGNAEFEREQNPSVARWALFREAMMGGTPALAPGAMIQIGLLGLLYGFLAGRRR